MSMYGEAAVKAVQLFKDELAHSPREAWETAIAKFTDSPSSQAEGCPKSAFLGLCEAGLVMHVPAGSYTRSRLNKNYAIHALKLLLQNPKRADDEHSLWLEVAPKKAYHGQVAIVISLFQNGMIVPNATILLAAWQLGSAS